MKECYLLFNLLQEKDWSIKAVYLPGARNVIADSLSRKNQILPSEWSLHPQVVKAIFRTWETPMIDLFATSKNKKLPLYVSPLPDQEAWAEDPISRLDRPERLRLSSSFNNPQSSGEDFDRVLQHNSDSTSLASPVLVQPSSGHVSRSPSKTSSNTKTTEADSVVRLPFKSRTSQASCLEIARGKLQKQGFSEELADRILGPQELPQEKSMEPDGPFFVLGARNNRQILSRPLLLS